ncbi:MAG: aminopeptidase P family protein [Pseudanabaenaceae cyanobacterium SKYGB_i_bin29]|nr:aminopeptidase P family protein [Pseudanabaenaceae cyanobacterium SKYG29]MDW8422421.1 aminopeptidase P family protein [Pseudanabaenaceae cyanobacterium SKYGB_i_bin29]
MMAVLGERRRKLVELVGDSPVLLWSGVRQPRNFPANTYPFRASSHFLYFAGLNLENAVLALEPGRTTLFWDEPPPSYALWHGDTPKGEELAAQIGADAYYPKAKLSEYAHSVTVPVLSVLAEQREILGTPPQLDSRLALAIVACRLTQDEIALQEIRRSAQVTIAAHLAGMDATPRSQTCAQVRGAIEGVIIAHNCSPAYNSIVTTQGQVLHSETYTHPLQSGDLLLVDVGAEVPRGWATDVTRTYPVSGKFSPTQKAIYEIVLQAQLAAIAMVRPGVEYQDVHLTACLVLTEGLVELGILRGKPSELVAKHIHSAFFPHGVGHLLGLDVHDMEDLGDIAGYAPGRERSTAPGWKYLRLHRPLQAGMVVTIEPGFYQVPHILQDPLYHPFINWERLAEFRDVKGIRIEDDVLVTPNGYEVLTQELPKTIGDLESLLV